MLKYTLAFFCFGLVLWWDVKTDYRRWKNKKPINHKTDWLIRVLLISPSIVLLSFPSFHIWNIVFASLLEGFLFWELFDGFYNKLRGFSWRFNGTIDPDDSFLDRILYKLTPIQETILKWGLILISALLYILT